MSIVPKPIVDELRAAGNGAAYRFVRGSIEHDPLALVRAGAHLTGRAFFFSTPDGARVGGLGSAWRSGRSGADRFASVGADLRDAGLPAAAKVFLGYSFADGGPIDGYWSGFGSCDAVLPIVTAEWLGDRSEVTIAVPPGADVEALANLLESLRFEPEPRHRDLGDHIIESHPHVSEWTQQVSDAVAAIRAGELDKVVLARSVLVRSTIQPAGFDLVHQLASAYPGCYTFGWSADDAVFLGASPELVVEVDGDRLRSNPLAGSAARGEGEEDRALGESLMASDKDRLEHAIVVDDVAARLGAHADELHVPAVPSLRRVATVQHLSTEITGRLRPNRRALDVLADLVPTPAVGGTPRHEAAAFIDKHEAIDRGWYTGGIGWCDPSGNGVVALALRCGLIRGSTAHVYAGAGIVADSDPEQELAETRLKLRPLLQLLAAT